MASKRFFLALALLASLLAERSLAQGVKFHDLAFDQAAERAATENKVVFVDFFTTWCVPCKQMDATTFQDPEVAEWLAEHTVALKVDAEGNETNEALAKRFGVRALPNYVFISPDGNLMGRIAGKRSPEQFIDAGESVLRGENALDRARSVLNQGDPNDQLAENEELQEQMRETHRDMLRGSVASTYQVLIGAGHLDEATVVAGRLTEALDDADSYNALAWAGYLTGSPVQANLDQARRAFEMTGGENIAMVDTLARVLATLGHRDEAISVAEAGLAKAGTTHDRQTMTGCLEYCRKQPAG